MHHATNVHAIAHGSIDAFWWSGWLAGVLRGGAARGMQQACADGTFGEYKYNFHEPIAEQRDDPHCFVPCGERSCERDCRDNFWSDTCD